MKGREDNGIRGRGPRNHGRGRGRGYVKFEARFKGANGDLPFLDYGSTGPGNKPIEFLESFGEYCAVHHKSVIYPAFYNT